MSNRFYCEILSQEVYPIVMAFLAKELIENRGFTQVNAAKKLGVSQPAVSNYMRRLENLPAERMEKYMTLLEKTKKPISIFFDHSDMPEDPHLERIFQKTTCETCRLIRNAGLIDALYSGACCEDDTFMMFEPKEGWCGRSKFYCMFMIEDVFPAVRSLIARELIEVYGYSQSDAAFLLERTQPAISQYKNCVRVKNADTMMNDECSMELIRHTAARLHETRNLPDDERRREVAKARCKLCRNFRECGVLPLRCTVEKEPL